MKNYDLTQLQFLNFFEPVNDISEKTNRINLLLKGWSEANKEITLINYNKTIAMIKKLKAPHNIKYDITMKDNGNISVNFLKISK